MAENKKSFVLYVDHKEIFNELSNEDAGELIKHIFSYVSDQNPKTENPIVKLAFISIKLQLKRDLIRYEEKKTQWSEAGKASAEKRKSLLISNKYNSTDVNSVATVSTDVNSVATVSTVNVNDNVNVNVTDNVNVNVNKKVKEKIVFSPPTLFEVVNYFNENGYTAQAAEKAFKYYEAGNWKDSKGLQVKSWKQKMQGVWFKEENKTKEEQLKLGTPEWVKNRKK